MLADMLNHGFNRVVCVSINLKSLPDLLAFSDRYDCVYASVGVHPSSLTEVGPNIETLVELAQHPKVV